MHIHQEMVPNQILFEDNPLFVANKVQGLLSQGDISRDSNLLDMGKIILKNNIANQDMLLWHCFIV
jgi:23S rRNA-/tRNA-specific pseudouridylate synthase